MTDFVGGSGSDVFNGGEGADTASGGGGSDSLIGNGGNDILAGDDGADYIEGGDGDDILFSRTRDPAAFTFISYRAVSDDFGTEVDTLVGGAGDDYIIAGYGDNVDGGTAGSYGNRLYISFRGASSGVTADFRPLQTPGGSVTIGGGVITNIQTIGYLEGSDFDDLLVPIDTYYPTGANVYGRGGNDHIIADYYSGWGGGALYGGDGNDIVDGRTAQYGPALYGDAGNDTLYTNANSFASAYGGDGNDTIYAHGLIDGGADNDTIYLQASYYAGQVNGGTGDDIIYTDPNQGHSAIFGDAGNDQLYGGSGNDTLNGGDDNDTIDGGGGSNTLNGGNGNDRLILGSGSNGTVVDGGAGTDTLVINAAVTPGGAINGIEAIEFNGGALTISSSQATGLAAATSISGTGSMTVNQQPNIAVNLSGFTLAVGANVTFTFNGSTGDDTQNAPNAATALNGGNGNDSLYGGSAGDTLDGGAGVDLLDGGGGNDRLVVAAVGSGSSVNGGSGTDTLAVSGTVSLGAVAAIEAVELTAGSNLILTTSQAMTGLAFNTALSGSGMVTINMDAGVLLSITGFQGAAANPGITFTINGTSGVDAIKAAHFSNTISGGAGTDQIRGGNGVDTIDGGTERDKIAGWGGADILTGGGGNDQFRYLFATDSGLGAAADRITDFTIGGDVIDLRLLDSDLGTAGVQGYTYSFIGAAAFTNGGGAQVRYADSGADLLVQLDLDGNGVADMEIVLQGLAGQTMTAGDFLFV